MESANQGRGESSLHTPGMGRRAPVALWPGDPGDLGGGGDGGRRPGVLPCGVGLAGGSGSRALRWELEARCVCVSPSHIPPSPGFVARLGSCGYRSGGAGPRRGFGGAELGASVACDRCSWRKLRWRFLFLFP